MSDWKDMRGMWADAFPEGISSTEIVRCNRNGWDYEDYIRLRDMGVDPEDIAATAKRIADLEAQVTRLQTAVKESQEMWREEGYTAVQVGENLHPGDLDPVKGDTEAARWP